MIVELFSGLGRFETDEEVIYVGIQRETKPTICADVRFLPLRAGIKPKHLHASPPCKYLSLARYRRYGLDPAGIAETLELIASVFRAIDWLEPEHWTLENPVGLLGVFLNQERISYKAYDYKHKKTNFWSDNRALERSKISADIRERLLVEVSTS